MNNIYQYIAGNIFYFLSKKGMLPAFIQEQVWERFQLCDCKIEAKCCGCKVPNVFYAPKKCKFNKYSALIFSKSKWELIKLYGLDQQSFANIIVSDFPNLDITITRKLYSGVIFEFGENVPNDVKEYIFEFRNLNRFLKIIDNTKLPTVYGNLDSVGI